MNLFIDLQASISVPSTEKWSLLKSRFTGTVLNFVCDLGKMGTKEISHGPTQGT